MQIWMKDGKLITDADNHPIDCPECPCGKASYAILFFVTRRAVTSGYDIPTDENISYCDPVSSVYPAYIVDSSNAGVYFRFFTSAIQTTVLDPVTNEVVDQYFIDVPFTTSPDKFNRIAEIKEFVEYNSGGKVWSIHDVFLFGDVYDDYTDFREYLFGFCGYTENFPLVWSSKPKSYGIYGIPGALTAEAAACVGTDSFLASQALLNIPVVIFICDFHELDIFTRLMCGQMKMIESYDENGFPLLEFEYSLSHIVWNGGWEPDSAGSVFLVQVMINAAGMYMLCDNDYYYDNMGDQDTERYSQFNEQCETAINGLVIVAEGIQALLDSDSLTWPFSRQTKIATCTSFGTYCSEYNTNEGWASNTSGQGAGVFRMFARHARLGIERNPTTTPSWAKGVQIDSVTDMNFGDLYPEDFCKKLNDFTQAGEEGSLYPNDEPWSVGLMPEGSCYVDQYGECISTMEGNFKPFKTYDYKCYERSREILVNVRRYIK